MTQWQIKGGQKMTRQCEDRILLELPTCIDNSHHCTASVSSSISDTVELLHAVTLSTGQDAMWRGSGAWGLTALQAVTARSVP